MRYWQLYGQTESKTPPRRQPYSSGRYDLAYSARAETDRRLEESGAGESLQVCRSVRHPIGAPVNQRPGELRQTYENVNMQFSAGSLTKLVQASSSESMSAHETLGLAPVDFIEFTLA